MNTVVDYERVGNRGNMKHFVLLSSSPRRKDLLNFLNPTILEVVVNEREIEDYYAKVFNAGSFLENAAKICCEIAKAKSEVKLEKDTLYISADTIIVSNEKIYNKPKDNKEAREMLLSYFGKSHHSVTAVCLRMRGYREVFYSITKIDFVDYYPALEDPLSNYIKEYNLLDRAGAYSISNIDPRFISAINGDINTILGLPVSEISRRIFAK